METESWNQFRLAKLNQELADLTPGEVLTWGFDYFGNDLVMATGFGTSGIVLMHALSELHREDGAVFYLDTDLLFPETKELKERLSDRLGITFTRVEPEINLEAQEKRYGPALWERNPNTCCHIRKVLPLRRFLSDKKAWITGVRRDQSASRESTNIIEWDEAHQLVKLNPLAHWTTKEVWSYIAQHRLPYNALHDKGYPSIGCMPCTRATEPGEDDRAGRWSNHNKLECGIHLQPVAA